MFKIHCEYFVNPYVRVTYINICSGYCNKVNSGQTIVSDHDYAAFFYPNGTPHDPENIDKDLFRGHIFIRVRHIFSVLSETDSTFTRRYNRYMREKMLDWMVSGPLQKCRRPRCMEWHQ